MFNVGTQELLIILFVVLLLFGAKRIPEVARSLGKGVGDFRDALSGVERELKGETKPTPRDAAGAVPRTVDESPRLGSAVAGGPAGPVNLPVPAGEPASPPTTAKAHEPPNPPAAGADLAG